MKFAAQWTPGQARGDERRPQWTAACRSILAAGALLTLLAACSAQPPPPGASVDHDQQLNDAAAMLDANSVSTAAVPQHDEDGQ